MWSWPLEAGTSHSVKVGVPTLKGASVTAEIVKHGLGDKIVVFKFKRRKNYARKQGKLFNAADVLVLTTPMWNYNMPAILKAWFDQVLSPGITYEVEKTGPKPLHSIKKVVLLVASGGTYKEDDPADALGRGVAAALKFIGITDISVAWADGQNPLYFDNSETRKQMALEAVQEIAEEVAEMAAEF